MLKNHRRKIFVIATILFVITVPILTLFGLGYTINTNNYSLQNTLDIRVESFPIGAKLKLNNIDTKNTSPGNLNLPSSSLNKLSIEKTGYLSDEFLVTGENGTNSSARITNLWMLENNSNTIGQVTVSGQITPTILSNHIIWYENGKVVVQKYNVNGLNKQVVASLENEMVASTKADWEVVGEEAFFDKANQVVVWNSGNTWKSFQLGKPLRSNNQNLNLQLVAGTNNQIVRLNIDSFLILNQKKELWQLNLASGKLSFLETGVKKISINKDLKQIWIWQENNLYRIYTNSNEVALGTNPFITSALLQQPSICDDSCEFKVLNFFQGEIAMIGTKLLFFSDINSSWQYQVAEDASSLEVFEDTLFWTNQKGDIFSWNFFLKNQVLLGNIQLDKDKKTQLSYNPGWRRLSIYNDNKVYTVWFDKYILNRSIIAYYPNKWLEANCLTNTLDKSQYCIEDNKLVIYQNNSVF